MAVIVCYGDSNTHGHDPATGTRFPRSVRWPGVLRAALGEDHEVIEEGLNGRTTMWDDPYTAGRNGRAYLLPCLRSHQPIDVVVLMLGTNDTKTIFGRSAAEIAHAAGVLVDDVLASRCGPDGGPPRVLLVAPPAPGPSTARSELWGFGEARAKGEQFGRLYAVAAELAGVTFLDAGPLVEADPADGVHLSAVSHAALGEAIACKVGELLG